ncbi:MAG: protein-L-isoaspartate(D-aspartate) O-methyltransferase [Alphaproteobacteria bacterium]|nr:protein-L-isoaspartate(D-aspartate) O-methyltransferase [Alphaproteobacteria bacterium]
MTSDAAKIRLLMELRSQGIADTKVLEAIERVPRERFVAEPFRAQAYDNIALPIAQGQTISQPYVVAFMTEALRLGPRMKVLEIGTGSGYQTAVLARLARRVYTIERYRSLLCGAEARFAELRLTNIVTRLGDGARGWPEVAPFERILVTAAAERLPLPLVEQLNLDGILVVPVGPSGEQEVLRVTRRAAGIDTERLLPVRFVPLVAGVADEA